MLGIEKDMQMKKREGRLQEILAIHKYSISKGSDGRWKTYLPDEEAKGRRRLIAKGTKEKLYDALLKFYDERKESEEPHRLCDIFARWIEYKKGIVTSPNTILRHKQHYQRYFAQNPFFQKPIEEIDRLSLNMFCNDLVKRQELSSKEWQNVKTILKGIFEYAFDMEWIKEDPMRRVKITVRYRQVTKKPGRRETFSPEETESLFSYLEQRFSETKDPVFLGIRLNFLLGLRQGELCALRWSDVCGDKLHIHSEEVRDQERGEYRIVDHTKTHTDRFVFLVPKATEILGRLREITEKEEFIFTRDHTRINARQFSYVLQKYAERTGSVMKSSHKMRKTYASTLALHDVPIDEIRAQLGHADLATTYGYLYNPLSEAETYQRIKEALMCNQM